VLERSRALRENPSPFEGPEPCPHILGNAGQGGSTRILVMLKGIAPHSWRGRGEEGGEDQTEIPIPARHRVTSAVPEAVRVMDRATCGVGCGDENEVAS
jgi:hypothetical protein